MITVITLIFAYINIYLIEKSFDKYVHKLLMYIPFFIPILILNFIDSDKEIYNIAVAIIVATYSFILFFIYKKKHLT